MNYRPGLIFERNLQIVSEKWSKTRNHRRLVIKLTFPKKQVNRLTSKGPTLGIYVSIVFVVYENNRPYPGERFKLVLKGCSETYLSYHIYSCILQNINTSQSQKIDEKYFFSKYVLLFFFSES